MGREGHHGGKEQSQSIACEVPWNNSHRPMAVDEKKLQERLVGITKEVDGYRLETTKLHSCTGESRVLIVRGKKRSGFELRLELDCKGVCGAFGTRLTCAASKGGAETTAKIVIEEVSETSLDDFDVSVFFSAGLRSSNPTCTQMNISVTPASHGSVKHHIASLQKDIEQAIRSICDQMITEW